MSKPRFRTLFSYMLWMQLWGLTMVLALLCTVVLVVSYSQRMHSEKEALLECATELDATFKNGEYDSELAKELASGHGLLIQVCSAIGTDSYYSDPIWKEVCGAERGTTKYSQLYAKASTVFEYTRGYFNGNTGFSTLTLFSLKEGKLLLIHSNITGAFSDFGILTAWMVAVFFVGLLMCVLICNYCAHRVVDPFVRINHIVRCYSRGDFSQRIPAAGTDEASQLGRSFNEMAEQLKDLEATRRSFVANVSHELRSPLTSMKGFLDAMYDGTIPPEEHEHYLGVVLSETRRLADMVNDLLDLARIESGTVTLQYSTFDINELIRRTLITFEARIVEKKLELDIRFAQERCFVSADSKQISQVLRNLIDNAIKYSPEGKSLMVSTYAMRKDVYVSIRDNGVGIPKEDLPHVFDRFYKVEKAHTPSPQVGSGLGLSIVQRIIEQHGQSITVQSAKGRGTQFTFTLTRVNMPRRSIIDGGKNYEA